MNSIGYSFWIDLFHWNEHNKNKQQMVLCCPEVHDMYDIYYVFLRTLHENFY